MIIGTSGHIDHGKTALVKALTGVEGDRLKEEKARGITIDLGFAYLPTPLGQVLGFIDVPGHERFVHTMVAGASGIDIALLTVAADDGVKPQTLEHLAIIDLLGIRRGVVVITKADLAEPDRITVVSAQTRAAAAGTVFETADILLTSATTGIGIDELRAYLIALSSTLVGRAQEGLFRLAVDRVFTLAGIGVIVTGTILSGSVHIGDSVQISPSGLIGRVRSIHAQNRTAETAMAGDRCALNLAGAGISKSALRRGDVVIDPALHAPADRIDAVLHVLKSEEKAIPQWFPVRLHHGAAEVGARVVLLDDRPIQPGATAVVQLVLDQPIAAAVPDRFVVRDVSARRTVGGGKFIDLRPPVRKRRTQERRQQRSALAIDDPKEAFAALLATPPFVHGLSTFARDRNLSPAQTGRLVTGLNLVTLDGADGQAAISSEQWGTFASALIARLQTQHTENPDQQGIGSEQLRLSLMPRLPKTTFPAALKKLVASGGIVCDGAFVRLASHRAHMSAVDEAAWGLISPLLAGPERFRPPRVRDIAAITDRPERDVRRLLKLASRLGWVDEVAHDHFFLRDSVREMLAIAADVAAYASKGEFTAADLRDRLDNGRKVAIQILDFFDRNGVTLRRGDLRRLNKHRLDLFRPL